MRIESQIGAHDITWMGHLMVSVDTHGQLFIFKVSYPHQDQLSIAYIVSLLEYCFVVGYDPLDIFLTLKIPFLDSIVDRLTENFTRQPSSVQQYYYVNFLTMKTNLYRLVGGPKNVSKHNPESMIIYQKLQTFNTWPIKSTRSQQFANVTLDIDCVQEFIASVRSDQPRQGTGRKSCK